MTHELMITKASDKKNKQQKEALHSNDFETIAKNKSLQFLVCAHVFLVGVDITRVHIFLFIFSEKEKKLLLPRMINGRRNGFHRSTMILAMMIPL